MKVVFSLVLSLILFNLSAQNFNQQKLNQYFDVLEKENQVMGSFAMAYQGEIIYERQVGFASIEDSLPINATTQFRVGSISKTFTATLILKLAQLNKLSLNDKLSNYFPQIENSKSISLKMLLNHSSGIYNFTNNPKFFEYLEEPKTQKELLEIITEGGSDFKPGSDFNYSNSNYVLLTFIAEKTTGKPINELLEQYIFKPVQLEHTAVGGPIEVQKNQARSYIYTAAYSPATETNMSIPLGAGFIISTPSDLCRFFHALRTGAIIPQALADSMIPPSESNYGLGLFPFPFKGKVALGHNGGIDGFVSSAGHFDIEQLSVSYTISGTQLEPNEIMLTMLSAYFGEDFELPNFDIAPLSDKEIARLSGTYKSPSFPLDIKIFGSNGQLMAQATGQGAFKLKSLGNNRFEFKAAQILMQFNPEKDQLVFSQGGATTMFKR